MKNKKLLPSESELSYFRLQAYWGVSHPHGGGLKATNELIKLCQISKNKDILDVGCGVGITACYIAKNYDCKVVGIDISKEFIDRARERVKKQQVKNKVEFEVAHIQHLPFKDNNFDIVIGESVIAFLEDKQKGINECVRVVKSSGYVGFNEATWIKIPPPAELAEYISRITGARLETTDTWKELLKSSGLRDIEVRTYKIN